MKPEAHTMPPALLTYDDYCQIPADGNRYEVINGRLHMSPAPYIRHQRILRELFTRMHLFVKQEKLGEVFCAPVDIVLSDHNVVQPDILFVSTNNPILTKKNAQGPPDLVIEILSEHNRRYDEIVKRQLYESYGVMEYWIIDPALESIKVLHLEKSVYRLKVELSMDQEHELSTALLPGFICPLAALFDL